MKRKEQADLECVAYLTKAEMIEPLDFFETLDVLPRTPEDNGVLLLKFIASPALYNLGGRLIEGHCV